MPEPAYLQWPVFRRSVVAAFGRSLTLDQAGNSNDYPAAYRVDFSDGGPAWTTIKTGNGTQTMTSIVLPSTYTKRYVPVTETGGAGGNWFSVNELRLYLKK